MIILKKNIHLLKFLAEKFNNIHLRTKLLICYGSLIVFIVFIIGFFAFNKIQEYIYDQAIESYNQMLIQIKLNIENKLNIYDELVNQITTDKSLIYSLSNRYDSVADYSYEYLETISKALEIKQKDNNVQDAFILKDNDTLPENSLDLINIEHAGGTWWFRKYFEALGSNMDINDYIKLSKLKIWIVTDEDIKPRYDSWAKTKKVKRVVIIKPIIRNYKDLTGIYKLYIKYDAVFGELKEKNDHVRDRIIIMDQQNEVIFNSDTTIPVNVESFLGEKDKMEGSFELKESNRNKLILYAKGENSNWTYFREIPMDVLFFSAKAVRSFSILTAIAGIIISFIIGAAIANVLSRRIVILSNSMKKVEDLNLDLDVKVDGKDEIGDLAKSYNYMIRKIRSLVEQLRISQQIQKESELKALQAQINPHFLYNTLSTINWMAMGKHTEKIISMVDNLSLFYRLSLNKGREYLSIDEEVSLVKAYTDIQKTRMDHRINFFYDISDDIMKYYTLKLILQPFVENAILHGADRKKKATNIVVKGFSFENDVIFEIIDDGVGMKNVDIPVEQPYSGGYGIRNVHEKIRLLYGEKYGVCIFSRLGIGTKATITIPKIIENSNLC